MLRKHRKLAAFAGFAPLAVVMVGCTVGNGPIISAVEQAVSESSDGQTAHVDFDLIIDGSWNQLAIVCSFTSNDEVEKALGFRWEGAPVLDANTSTDYLVFASDSEVLKAESVPRGLSFCTYGDDPSDGVRIVLREQSAMTLYHDTDEGAIGDVTEWWMVDPDSVQVNREVHEFATE